MDDIVLVNNCRETFTPTVSGAIATCLWEVARAASADGHQPVILSQATDAEPYPWPHLRLLTTAPAARPELAERVIRRATGRASDRRAWAHAVVRHLTARPARTIVCNNDPELAVELSTALPNATIVHWFHNLERSRDRWTRAYLASRVRSVAVSAYLARAVEHAYGLVPRSVEVVYNGVDSDRFCPTWSAPDGPPPATAPVVLGFLGRIAVEKAPDHFLRAALLLADHGMDFAVQLVGDTNWHGNDGGPYGVAVRELAQLLRARGIEVRAPGHVSRSAVPHELRRADVHVMTSEWDEPFALTTLEGMSTGLAVVATATGGTPEVVGDAGTLVARADPGTLATALTPLIADPGALRAAKLAAHRRAQQFTWAQTWSGLHDCEPVP